MLRRELNLLNHIVYFPIFVYLIAFISLIFVKNLLIVEVLIVPLISWWTVWAVNEYIQDYNFDLLSTYPNLHLKYNYWRIFTLSIFHFLVLTLVLLIFYSNNFISLWIQYTCQILVFSGFSLLLLILIKNVEATLCIIIIYIVGEWFGLSKIIIWYHAFYFYSDPAPISLIIDKAILNALVGWGGLVLFHYIMKLRIKGFF
ncbi:hypothetical protein [Priestia megaterium]|uniref:hypothetical protein n=1 Tax=Priestia megaterium TaxID=1404 RepID=UPI001A9440FE|nr:hypothetical protein [Priestia megaterium]QSX24150.1 hypothetical protein J0P05_31475 [Priestia megaterium]